MHCFNDTAIALLLLVFVKFATSVSVAAQTPTWKELGIASKCLGITRADLLENLVQQNKKICSDSGENEQLNSEKSELKAQKFLNKDELSSLANKVLKELR